MNLTYIKELKAAMPASGKILVIGAAGQIGTELVMELRSAMGNNNVIAADIKVPGYEVVEGGPFEILDVLQTKQLKETLKKHGVKQVYLLAALLSATAEQNPDFAWRLNVNGLLNLLNIAKEKIIDRIFWPSSIAVFGPSTPKDKTPQFTITEPSTVYGISKLTCERWCEYYHFRHGVDVRSVRYPGLISYKSAPGGGTTDYAVHIFHQAIREKSYTCFLKENTVLPMMYMPDAIRATMQLMESETEKIKIRSSYNIHGMSFSPMELAAEIKKHFPDFTCDYKPDYRQQIAATWPESIDDRLAKQHWGWQPSFNLKNMTADMIQNVKYRTV